MKLRYSAFIFILLLGNQLSSVGQSGREAILLLQKQALEELYSQENGNMSRLIDGKNYYYYYPSLIGDPFWITKDWTAENLVTHDYNYPSLLLKYDAYHDALIFGSDLILQRFIWVNPDQVVSFTLRGKIFIYIAEGEEIQGRKTTEISPGYFELLYDGKSQLIAKRKKIISQIQNDANKIGEFREKSLRYLVRGKQFYSVKSRSDLFRFLGPHKEVIISYLKQNKIRFRTISDGQFTELMAYYDSL